MSVLVIIPSRGRPEELREAVQSVWDTSEAVVCVCIDRDQEDVYALDSLRSQNPRKMAISVGPRVGPVVNLNDAVAHHRDFDAYGVLTDDAKMVVEGWDEWLMDMLGSFPNCIGVVSPYHNVGGHCDMPYVSRGWIEAVGWYACPVCRHYAWPIMNGLIGEMTAICHAPRHAFAINHRDHPRDEGTADHKAFFEFLIRGLPEAVERVRAAMVAT